MLESQDAQIDPVDVAQSRVMTECNGNWLPRRGSAKVSKLHSLQRLISLNDNIVA